MTLRAATEVKGQGIRFDTQAMPSAAHVEITTKECILQPVGESRSWTT